MIRHLMVAATAAGLAFGSAAALAQQQPMPSPPAQGSTTQSSGTMGQKPAQPQMDKQKTTRSSTRSQGSQLDSIASGLNACQLKSESERQTCVDQVIRDNGG